jgi:ribosomal protein S18 acetylase RimI-like enzyme
MEPCSSFSPQTVGGRGNLAGGLGFSSFLSSGGMGLISYFKRFRMELDLLPEMARPGLPPGYSLVRWENSLLETHATTLFESFRDEIDAVVFPSLGSRTGCSYLMTEICRKPGFTPGATWLATHGDVFCATVQGVRERNGMGAIQNLGVTAGHRGKGLGTALLLQALHGFLQAGLGRSFLEVTAQNDGAVRLYRRLGFRRRKTLYKAVETAPTLQNVT